ncbi:MAG: hypothetical protein ACRY3E_05340 [Candidatus Lariskella arthropodorum]
MQERDFNFQENKVHYAVFDTHKHIKELQACGFDEKQAEVLVKSLLHSRDYDLERLATKEQVNLLQKELKKDLDKFATKEQLTTLQHAINERLASVQHEMEFIKKDVQILDDKISTLGENIKKDTQALEESVKKDAKILDDKISNLGANIKKDMQALDESVKKDIKTLEKQMVTYVGIMKWSATLLVTLVLGVIGILVKVW